MLLNLSIPVMIGEFQFLILSGGFLMILFGRTPSFIRDLNSNHPKFSIALCCVGWIPYASFIYLCIVTWGLYLIFVAIPVGLIAYYITKYY